MATSGITAWSLTARDIITAALQENAVVGLGRTPTAAEMAACLVRLNGMLKSWLPSGHLDATATITIPAASASGVLDAGMGEIISARLVVSATSQREMFRMGRAQYYSLPNKAQAGTPLGYYVSDQLAALTMYVWPVPTVETTLQVDYVRLVETVTDLTETVDIPQKYQEALYANLALRCAGLFGAEPGGELIARAQRLEREMLDAERPASYFFESECA